MAKKRRSSEEGDPKRQRTSESASPLENNNNTNNNTTTTTNNSAASSSSTARASSNIIGISRTIAACQRCRQKKTKCDQQFPSCARCTKAGVPCVGLDPATGRQIPRSYVIYLEDRISHLEQLLQQKGLDPDASPAENSATAATTANATTANAAASASPVSVRSAPSKGSPVLSTASNNDSNDSNIHYANHALNTAASDRDHTIGSSLKLSVPSTNFSGLSFYIGDSSGISFAKLLFTAVKFHPSSINENNSITTRVPTTHTSKQITTTLPTKANAEYLVKCYFEQSNTQLPIMHREYFIENYFKPIYGNLSPDLKLASNYTKMNLVNSPIPEEDTFCYQYNARKLTSITQADVDPKLYKPLFFLNMIFAVSSSVNLLQYNPETSNSYRQQAMEFVDVIYSSEDRLECVQGLLLLTLYAIMRPCTPGVWYVLGTTLRLCVDLGLHTEKLNNQFTPFVKDLRRRLFWCAYSLDRQVCVYLGRPFGIPEESVSTKFPIELDDCLINPNETQEFTSSSNSLPTYKTISINFFKIRRIQAEILQVLYFTSSTLPRFYNNLNDWKLNIDNQLEHWFKTIPLRTSRKSNCDFNFEFFKLNYYHTKLLLFGVTPKNTKPNNNTLRIIFEASRGIINCYSELFKSKTINYTWSAVHNLFMAGTSFFYAIYNSKDTLIDLPEFEKHSRVVIDVLNSLVESCDAASSCVEIFEILSLAMIRLKFEDTENTANSKIVTTSDFDDIERFFEQLNQKTPSDYGDVFRQPPAPSVSNKSNGDGTETPVESQPQSVGSVAQTPENDTNSYDMNYPSLSTPPVSSAIMDYSLSANSQGQDFEQQKIFDLMNQVSSEAIYKQLFGPGSFTG